MKMKLVMLAVLAATKSCAECVGAENSAQDESSARQASEFDELPN